jgi:hypothetical protein
MIGLVQFAREVPMRLPAGTAIAIALVFAALGSAPVSAQRPSEGYWYCRSASHLDPVYVTPAWAGTASVIGLNVAFTEFLAKNYGHKGDGDCRKVELDTTTQAALQALLDRQHATMEQVQKKKIVQTGWTNGVAPGTPVQRSTLWVACKMSFPKPGQPVGRRPELRIYLTDAMPHPGVKDNREVSAAFGEFLAGKYGFKGGGSQCVGPSPEPDVQQLITGWANEAAKYQHELIKTGWKFTTAQSFATPTPAKSVAPPAPAPPSAATGAAALPPTPPPPQTAPASVQHAICYGDVDPATKYYSAVFDSTRGDYADWMPAFQKYLEQTYKYRGLVRCNKQPSQAAAEKYRATLIAGARNAALPGGAKLKVVETGWIYK